jgi:hypothetical protein
MLHDRSKSFEDEFELLPSNIGKARVRYDLYDMMFSDLLMDACFLFY